MKKATAKDVAALAGVSRSLVSMVLSGNPNAWISPETRQRIDAAVRELNYTPNRTARSLRNGRSGLACLIMGGLSDPGSNTFAENMITEFERCGMRLYLSFTRFDPRREHDALEDAMLLDYDAIVYSLWPDYVEDLQKKVSPEYPLFYTEAIAPGAAGHTVCPDINEPLETVVRENPGKSIALWSKRTPFDLPEGILPIRQEDGETLLRERPDVVVVNVGTPAVSPELLSQAPGYNPKTVILDIAEEKRAAKLADAVLNKIEHPDASAVRLTIPATIRKGI